MSKLTSLIVISLTLLTGCASPPPLKTSSGRPEVVIPSLSPQQVVDAIVARAARKGHKIKSSNGYSITLAKPADSIMAGLIYGSRYDSKPESRVTFTAVPDTRGTRVYATGEIVTNPNSAFERTTDLTKNSGSELQDVLLELRREIAPRQ